MSDCIKKENMDGYMNLTDEVIRQILLNPDPRLKESQKLVHDICSRKMYKLAAESPPFRGMRFKNEQKKEIKDEMLAKLKKQLGPVEGIPGEDDVVIELVSFDYGNKDKNPWDQIHFYSKDNPTVAKTLPPHEISFRVPESFQEQIVRVFLKPQDGGKIDEKYSAYLKRAFDEWVREKTRKV